MDHEPSHSPQHLQLAHDARGPISGLPVVLLHAFPLDRSMWRDVAATLADAGVRVLAIDLPGSGESATPGALPSLDHAADAVAQVLVAHGVARAVVAGVSMGGYVSLALVRRHPALVAGLALLDTKATADDDAARAHRERVAAAVEGDTGTRALLPMLDGLVGATTRRTRPDLVADLGQRLRAARPDGVAWCQRAMAGRQDSTPLLAGLAVPVAVVVGEEDALTPPDVARATAAELPDAVLTVVPRAGHLSPLEAPDDVAAALTALLVRVRPGG